MENISEQHPVVATTVTAAQQPQALISNVSQQTGVSIYSVKPAVLEFRDTTLTLSRGTEQVFQVPITEVTKIKNYGELLYIWIGRKSYTINFANNEALKQERNTAAGANMIAGVAGSTATMAVSAVREGETFATVEQWISLFTSYGIKAKHRKFYQSKVLWVGVIIMTLIICLASINK